MSRRFADFSRPITKPLDWHDLTWLVPAIMIMGACVLMLAFAIKPYF